MNNIEWLLTFWNSRFNMNSGIAEIYTEDVYFELFNSI